MLGQSREKVDVPEDFDILQGFDWENMSCSYDAVFTTFWILYSTGYPRIREHIKSDLNVLGNAFDGMMNQTLSRADANKQIRDTYFQNNRDNDFTRGVFQSIPTVLDHLLSQCVMSLISSDDIDTFLTKYMRYCRCPSLSCGLKFDECVKRVLNFNGEVDTFESVSIMLEQHFEPNNRHFKCELCNELMVVTNVIVSMPLVVCICFTGALVGCEFERNIIIREVPYELVSVIYAKGCHFKCRLNVNGSAYTYDGMIKGGKFQSIGQNDPFPGTVYHSEGEIIMNAQSIIYVRKI